MYLTYLQVSLNFFENRFENHFTDTHLIFSNLKKTDNERIIAEIYSLFYQSFACISYSCMQKHKNIYTVSLWLLIECEGSLVLWGVSPDLIIFISGFLEIILNRPWSNHCGIRWTLEVSLRLDGEQYMSIVAAGGEPLDLTIPFHNTISFSLRNTLYMFLSIFLQLHACYLTFITQESKNIHYWDQKTLNFFMYTHFILLSLTVTM